MAIASRVMRQSNSSIGTQKLNSCFSWQVGIWLLHVVHLLSQQRKSCDFDTCGWNHFSMDLIVMTRFSHAFSWACCTAFRSFCQRTCFLMDTTSSVMCLGVAWIGMKNVWKVCALLVKIQDVGSRSQAQLEEGHAMGWRLIDLWWRATLTNLRNVAHDGSDNFNFIQIAYCAGLLTYSG